MAYEKTTVPGLGAAETAATLDTGHIVAVSCERVRVDSGVAFKASARLVDIGGNQQYDANGKPVTSSLAHTVSPQIIDEIGADEITRDCLMAVMGEPVQTAWTDVFLSSASIRASIAAASIAGHADAGALI